jgi:hypothetical protein
VVVVAFALRALVLLVVLPVDTERGFGGRLNGEEREEGFELRKRFIEALKGGEITPDILPVNAETGGTGDSEYRCEDGAVRMRVGANARGTAPKAEDTSSAGASVNTGGLFRLPRVAPREEDLSSVRVSVVACLVDRVSRTEEPAELERSAGPNLLPRWGKEVTLELRKARSSVAAVLRGAWEALCTLRLSSSSLGSGALRDKSWMSEVEEVEDWSSTGLGDLMVERSFNDEADGGVEGVDMGLVCACLWRACVGGEARMEVALGP